MSDLKSKVMGAIDGVAERAKGAAEMAFDAGGKLPLSNPLSEQATAKVQQWAGGAADAAKQAGARAQSFAGDLGGLDADKLKAMGKDLAGVIARHPIPAVLVGIGLGILLGRGGRS